MGGGMTMSYRFSRLVRSAGGALISSPPYRRPVTEKLPHLLGHALAGAERQDRHLPLAQQLADPFQTLLELSVVALA
jgi:hypothetical protein